MYIYELLISSRWETFETRATGVDVKSKTLPPSSFAFFLQLPFSTKCRLETAQRPRTTNSPWRTIRRDGKIDPARKWEIRTSTDVGFVRKRCTVPSPSPRKRSMSLLAGSWRSTEPGTLKRKLNEISNRQELPRIGPIKPPPVPRTYTRVY